MVEDLKLFQARKQVFLKQFKSKIWRSFSSHFSQNTLMLSDSRGVLTICILFLDFARFVIQIMRRFTGEVKSVPFVHIPMQSVACGNLHNCKLQNKSSLGLNWVTRIISSESVYCGAISLMWFTAMQIYRNKRKCLHKKRVPTRRIGLRHIVLVHQCGCCDVM